jgi:hypothetical protein
MFEINFRFYPPPSSQLFHAWALAHVGYYIRAIHALPLSRPTTPLDKTIGVLRFLHPLVEVHLPPFVDDFHPETKVILNRKAFIFSLAHSPRLFSNGPSSMVY